MKSTSRLLVTGLVILSFAVISSYGAKQKEINNLAFAGGGVFMPAHVGVLRVLQQKSYYNPKKIIGTSAGAFVGGLTACGYSAVELYYALVGAVPATDRNATLVGLSMLSDYGMKSGDVIIPSLDGACYAKTGVYGITLGQLAQQKNVQFTAVAYNLNDRKLEYLNNETYPDMKVSTAIMLSSSVPVLYTAPLFNGKRYLDGGARLPNPGTYFANAEEKKNTIVSAFTPNFNASSIEDVEDFASSLLMVMQENNLPDVPNAIEKRTIYSVMPEGIRDTEVSITTAQALDIYNAGYNGATDYFAESDNPFE